MSLTLLTPPAEEPVTLADAKLFARIDGSEEDTLVQALIVSARLHVEAVTGRILVTQGWHYAPERSPTSGRLRLPFLPVQAVTAVRLRDGRGSVAVVDPATLAIDLAAGRIAGLPAPTPGGTVEVDVTAGYGAAAAVPEPLRHAIRLLVAAWYEERGGPTLGPAIPPVVAGMLAPFRVRAL